LVARLLDRLSDHADAEHRSLLIKDETHGLAHGTYVAALCVAAGSSVPSLDMPAVIAAALFHDICNVPVGSSPEHEKRAGQVAQLVLSAEGWRPDQVVAVRHAIEAHRWPNREYADREGPRPSTYEAQVMRDLDELVELDLDRIVAIKLEFRRQHGISQRFFDREQYREYTDVTRARADVLLKARKEDSFYNDVATQLLFRVVKLYEPSAMLSDVGRTWLKKWEPFELLLAAIQRHVTDSDERRDIFEMIGTVLVTVLRTAPPDHFLRRQTIFDDWYRTLLRTLCVQDRG
jgi:hypothetical protein